MLAAWQPVETHPWSALMLTGAFLALVPWAWERTSVSGFWNATGAFVIWLAFLVLGQAGGWNRSEAISQIFLVGAIVATIWLASRQAPNDWMIEVFALGLIGLAAWGLWQSLGGLEQLQGLTEELPEHLRAGASARIGRGRAFASLLLPSHLAVVLATALPVLVVRIDGSSRGKFFGFAFLLGSVGLLATRSPVGVALAVVACALVRIQISRQRPLSKASPDVLRSEPGQSFGLESAKPRHLFWTLVVGLLAVGLVVGFRPDVLRLEPIALRLDNWSSALWVWSTAPFAGVGLGGFGLAAQTVPWSVGNHPVHAHSMPLELLADLGLFGLAVWVGAAVWFINLVKRVWIHRPDVAAALMVIPIHNLLDFSLYTSAVALPWAVLLGWSIVLTAQRGHQSRNVTDAFRWIPVFVGALAVGVAVLVVAADVFDGAARSEVPFDSRFDWAVRAATLVPWSSDATDLVGALALENGHQHVVREALLLVETRRWQVPGSAARAQLTGRLKALTGDPVEGAAELWKAQRFQPYEPRRREDFESTAKDLGRRRHGRR